MDKWMRRADSAHQIGPDPTFHALLIVVESGGRGGGITVGGIFHSYKLGMFWLVSPPPLELWTNGCDGQIQRIK